MPPPAQIGRYEIVDVIGRGGMGVVYKARDTILGRLVALKVMTSGLADNAEVRERFLREARAVSMLQHANIVVVFELGEHDGNPYIVMEYLDGEPLDRTIRANFALSILQKIDIILQVSKALQYAHERGIIHRDVKPGNIMLMCNGAVKVVDFGIAHLADQTITRSGMVLGTVSYMSPEQLNGQPVDARTDIFSLGIVFYVLLTGKLPFEGASTAETMMKILLEPPPRLAQVGDIDPPELQPIIDKALAKKKEERYPSCAEMAEALVHLRKTLEVEMQLAALERERLALLAQLDRRGGATSSDTDLPCQIPAPPIPQASSAGDSDGVPTQPNSAGSDAQATQQDPIASQWFALILVAVLIFVVATYFLSRDVVNRPPQSWTIPATSPLPGQMPAEDIANLGTSAFGNKNYAQALQWYHQAADQGNPLAEDYLGAMYRDGLGVEKDYAQAVQWFRKAADQGFAAAQRNLGWMYQNGLGVIKDYPQALQWYHKAADQGDPYAECDLGWMYQNGLGVNKDYPQALQWYYKAADQGHSYGEGQLGWMYQNGLGVDKDYVQAMQWYHKAADQGLSFAQQQMGVLYQKGLGVPKDKGQAQFWFQKAKANGYQGK